MLKFVRNKLVSVYRGDQGTLKVHGVLDDDIYGVEIDVVFSRCDLRVLDIEGRWNRWTTPECPRAVPFLKEALGLAVGDPGFSEGVQKGLSRRSCRHFANLLLECAHAARAADGIADWEDRKKADPGLEFEQCLRDREEQGAAGSGEAPGAATPNRPAAPENGASAAGKPQPVSGGVTIDLHVHTSEGSPCSSAPVEALIAEARRIGLQGICLTDHNHLWQAEEVEALRRKHGFAVFRGNEVTTDQGDMLVYGLYEPIEGIIQLDELRQRSEQAGAHIVAAHPFRGFLTFNVGQLGLTTEKAMERPLFRQIDGVEVMNSKVTAEENDLALQVARGLGLPKTGGSDAHEVNEVGIYATRFPAPIRTDRELVAALRRGEGLPVAFREERGGSAG